MKQQLFKQARCDLMSVPADKYTSKGWLALTRCLYELGYNKEALDPLSRNTDQKVEKKCYLSYLIFKDIGQTDLALQHLCTALQILPDPMMKRSLADFLLEIRKPDKAIPIYEHIHPICPSDISCIRNWAIACTRWAI